MVKWLQEQGENSPWSCYSPPGAATLGCTIPASPAQPSTNPPFPFLNSSFFLILFYFSPLLWQDTPVLKQSRSRETEAGSGTGGWWLLSCHHAIPMPSSAFLAPYLSIPDIPPC